MKKLYEVRVREKEGEREVKKSRFYWCSDPREAASKYKGQGKVMWVEKVPKEKLLGIGGFFNLGTDLLRELHTENSKQKEVKSFDIGISEAAKPNVAMAIKLKKNERRYNEQRKKATY